MKTLKHIPLLIILLFTLIQLFPISCTKAIIDEGSVDDLPPVERTITYQSDVKAIMDNYCITCHGGSAPQGNLDLTTYLNTKNAALNRNLVERMNSQTNPMPPGGKLAPQILQLIDKWVEGGLLESQ